MFRNSIFRTAVFVLLIALLLVGCGQRSGNADLKVVSGDPAATAYPMGTPTGAPVVNTPTAAPTLANTPTAVATLAAPTATKAPVATATTAPTSVPTVAATPVAGGPETFTYTPGGKNYVYPEDKTHDPLDTLPADLMNGEEGWTRIRIAANGQPIPWTFNTRIKANGPLEDVAQWRSATELLLTNQTATDITISVELKRDQLAEGKHVGKDGVDYGCGSCTPYSDANAKKSPLGLSWHITGSLASVVVNGAKPQELKGLGVYQLGFPSDFKGVWTLVITLKPGAQVTLNQGEKLTTVDTWPLPAAK